MYTPVNPSFDYIKVGFRGVKNIKACFRDEIYQVCPVLWGYILTYCGSYNIGIKHGFSCINIRQVPWEVLKTEAEGCGFQHLPRDLANVNALKKHVLSLLLHKN